MIKKRMILKYLDWCEIPGIAGNAVILESKDKQIYVYYSDDSSRDIVDSPFMGMELFFCFVANVYYNPKTNFKITYQVILENYKKNTKIKSTTDTKLVDIIHIPKINIINVVGKGSKGKFVFSSLKNNEIKFVTDIIRK